MPLRFGVDGGETNFCTCIIHLTCDSKQEQHADPAPTPAPAPTSTKAPAPAPESAESANLST